MSTQPGNARYNWGAVGLHWAVAVLVICTFPLGLYMVGLSLSPLKLKLYSYHKWIGVSVFLLMWLRIGWRILRPPPPLPASMPRWERTVAGAAHGLLYLLLIAAPLSGWLFSSAEGFQTVYLGIIPLPDLLDKDKILADFLRFIHMMLTFTLGGVILLHAGAALKHYFLDRDQVLSRMIPWLKRGDST